MQQMAFSRLRVILLELFVVGITLVKGQAGISCTFEQGLCGWQAVPNNGLLWKSGAGQTIDRMSGPVTDHTCNDIYGKYMYISGFDANGKNDSATLTSNQITISTPTNLTFWYLMNGFGTGNLTLMAVHPNTTALEVWSKTGLQGKSWTRAEVTLNPGTFSLQFLSTVTLPVGSDIALDDILLFSETQVLSTAGCLTTTTSTTTTTTTATTSRSSAPSSAPGTKTNSTQSPITTLAPIKSTHITTTSAPTLPPGQCSVAGTPQAQLLPGSCDFETGMCGINVVPSSGDPKVTWLRTNHSYGSHKVEAEYIAGDHTQAADSQDGYYMNFMKGSGGIWSKPPHDVAKLETPSINLAEVCLSFWYTLPNHYSNLQISINGSAGTPVSVWSTDVERLERAGQTVKLAGWHHWSLILRHTPPYKIIFESVNTHYMAEAGLDDIQIAAFNASAQTPSPTPAATTAPTTVTTIPLHSTEATSTLTTLTTKPIKTIVTTSIKAETTKKPQEVSSSLTPLTTEPIGTTSIKAETTKKPQVTKKPEKVPEDRIGENDKYTLKSTEDSGYRDYIVGFSVAGGVAFIIIVVVGLLVRKTRRVSAQNSRIRFLQQHEQMKENHSMSHTKRTDANGVGAARLTYSADTDVENAFTDGPPDHKDLYALTPDNSVDTPF